MHALDGQAAALSVAAGAGWRRLITLAPRLERSVLDHHFGADDLFSGVSSLLRRRATQATRQILAQLLWDGSRGGKPGRCRLWKQCATAVAESANQGSRAAPPGNRGRVQRQQLMQAPTSRRGTRAQALQRPRPEEDTGTGGLRR